MAILDNKGNFEDMRQHQESKRLYFIHFCFLFSCSVLHSAAYWDCASLIECYMKRNSNLMVTDAEGRTPLHYVFMNNRYDCKYTFSICNIFKSTS